MIRIDLGKEIKKDGPGKKLKLKLPPKVQAIIEETLSSAGSLVSLGVAIALAFLPYLVLEEYKKIMIQQHKEQIRDIVGRAMIADSGIAKLLPFQKELESYEAQRKLVNERLAVIRQLLAQRGTAVNVLDAVGQSLPARAWLKNVNISANGPSIEIEGRAISNEEISDFVDRLSESVHLSDVSLEDVGSTNGSGSTHIDVKNFSVAARSKAQMRPIPVITKNDGIAHTAPRGNVPGAVATPVGTVPAAGHPNRLPAEGK